MINTEYDKAGPKWQPIDDGVDDVWIVVDGWSFDSYARAIVCESRRQAKDIALALNRAEMQRG